LGVADCTILEFEAVSEFLGQLRASTADKQEVDGTLEAKSPIVTLFSARPAPTSASEEVQHGWSTLT